MSKQPQRNNSYLIAIATVFLRFLPAEGIEINSISVDLMWKTVYDNNWASEVNFGYTSIFIQSQ